MKFIDEYIICEVETDEWVEKFPDFILPAGIRSKLVAPSNQDETHVPLVHRKIGQL